jgi:hypothetical protein
MTGTGWPLIPRELLPAPVRPARVTRRPPRAQADTGRQLSIFGAETTEPSPADLAGLLAGPGRLGRMGGTARVSVRVDAAWRVHVLVAELVSRGLVVSWSPLPTERVPRPPSPEAGGPARHQDSMGDAADGEAPDGDVPDGDVPDGDVPDGDVPDGDAPDGDAPDGSDVAGPIHEPSSGHQAGVSFEVRTAYSSRLHALARAWPAAADRLFLSGPRLRLWVAAAGRTTGDGFALGLGDTEDPDKVTKVVDPSLRRAGLDGSLSEDGRAYLILGQRRLVRLAELVGDRPAAAPPTLWPRRTAA